MTTVADIIERKDGGIMTVAPTVTAKEAAAMMTRKHVGCLLVTDASGLIGVLTERDIVNRMATAEDSILELPISQLMRSKVRTVRPQDSVPHCMEQMTRYRVRYLPVLGPADELLGVISIGDVVKAQMDEQTWVIDQLGTYISGLPDAG